MGLTEVTPMGAFARSCLNNRDRKPLNALGFARGRPHFIPSHEGQPFRRLHPCRHAPQEKWK